MATKNATSRARHGTAAELPSPRGPVSAALIAALDRQPGASSEVFDGLPFVDDVLYGEDAPLALYVLYELHYRGFAGVDDEWEWDANALRLRARLERSFCDRLEDEGDAFALAVHG